MDKRVFYRLVLEAQIRGMMVNTFEANRNLLPKERKAFYEDAFTKGYFMRDDEQATPYENLDQMLDDMLAKKRILHLSCPGNDEKSKTPGTLSFTSNLERIYKERYLQAEEPEGLSLAELNTEAFSHESAPSEELQAVEKPKGIFSAFVNFLSKVFLGHSTAAWAAYEQYTDRTSVKHRLEEATNRYIRTKARHPAEKSNDFIKQVSQADNQGRYDRDEINISVDEEQNLEREQEFVSQRIRSLEEKAKTERENRFVNGTYTKEDLDILFLDEQELRNKINQEHPDLLPDMETLSETLNVLDVADDVVTYGLEGKPAEEKSGILTEEDLLDTDDILTETQINARTAFAIQVSRAQREAAKSNPTGMIPLNSIQIDVMEMISEEDYQEKSYALKKEANELGLLHANLPQRSPKEQREYEAEERRRAEKEQIEHVKNEESVTDEEAEKAFLRNLGIEDEAEEENSAYISPDESEADENEQEDEKDGNLSEIQQSVPEEDKEELKGDLKEEVKEEPKKEIKEEVKEEPKKEIKEEVKEEPKKEIKEEIKEASKEKGEKEELKEEPKEEVKEEPEPEQEELLEERATLELQDARRDFEEQLKKDTEAYQKYNRLTVTVNNLETDSNRQVSLLGTHSSEALDRMALSSAGKYTYNEETALKDLAVLTLAHMVYKDTAIRDTFEKSPVRENHMNVLHEQYETIVRAGADYRKAAKEFAASNGNKFTEAMKKAVLEQNHFGLKDRPMSLTEMFSNSWKDYQAQLESSTYETRYHRYTEAQIDLFKKGNEPETYLAKKGSILPNLGKENANEGGFRVMAGKACDYLVENVLLADKWHQPDMSKKKSVSNCLKVVAAFQSLENPSFRKVCNTLMEGGLKNKETLEQGIERYAVLVDAMLQRSGIVQKVMDTPTSLNEYLFSGRNSFFDQVEKESGKQGVTLLSAAEDTMNIFKNTRDSVEAFLENKDIDSTTRKSMKESAENAEKDYKLMKTCREELQKGLGLEK